MIVRCPSAYYYRNSFFEQYRELNNDIRKLIELEEDIKAYREEVSNLMHRCISRMPSMKEVNAACVIRRKAYKKIEYVYNKEAFKNFCSEHEYDIFCEDVERRKQLQNKRTQVEKSIEKFDIDIRAAIKGMALSEDFLLKLKYANASLYEIIRNQEGPKRKSHFITLLKYIYKQENCCTPSSLWSGVASTEKDYIYKNAIIRDVDKNSLKHIYRDDFRKNALNSLSDVSGFKVYLNPTLCKIDNKYCMCQFAKGKVTKITILTSPELEYIYEKYHKKVFYVEEMVHDECIGDDQYINALIQNDVIRPINPLEYGNSSLEIVDTYDGMDNNNYNIRFQNIVIDEMEEQRIHQAVTTGFRTYSKLFDAFWNDCFWGGSYWRLVEYIKKVGTKTLLDFLYSDFKFSSMKNSAVKKSRTWKAPRINGDRFEAFTQKIKSAVHDSDNKIIKFTLSDFESIIDLNGVPADVEIVAQIDNKNNILIPEMISLSKGRFTGRYAKYFPEENNLFYKKLELDDLWQVNVEINSAKDNISFDNPENEKKIVLYDYDETIQSQKTYDLNDLYLTLVDNKPAIVNAEGEQIEFYCASTLSAGDSKIYQLLCYLTNLDNVNAPIGGTAYSRIELDLDYQPRLYVDNLLLSRERWRFQCNDFFESVNVAELFELLYWKNENKLPDEFYVYTDMQEKPYYCRLGSTFDTAIFLSHIKTAEEYFYIEEVYPNAQTVNGSNKRNMEYIICT